METSRITVARWTALAALAFAVPFLLLNAIVAQRIEPLFSLIRPGIHTGPLEYPLLLIVLLLLPAGAIVALMPVLRKAPDGSRSYPVVNILVAGLLLTAFAGIGVTLGSEIYECDVLNVPYCD